MYFAESAENVTSDYHEYCFICPCIQCLVVFMVILTLCTVGSLTVEQVYRDRDEFAKLVRNVASPDLGRMGIEILSFTIR